MQIFSKSFILMALFVVLASDLKSQEFICNLQVNTQQVEGTDKRVYENMQSALNEFINNRKWTNYNFMNEERIECNFVITIGDRPSADVFNGRLNIVASRPVFGSAYNSNLINYVDNDFTFEYVEFQPIEFIENQDVSNLTSVLAYYLYIILGIDFDTFSRNGGTPFYEKAESIVNAAQNSSYPGWKSFEDTKNRYWLVENFLNNNYTDLRNFYYEYHRLGLDVMTEKAEQGRGVITKSLDYLKNVHDDQPGLFALQLILDAKRDEIVNVFSKGNPQQKSAVAELMKEIDPANTSKYSKITQGN
ncbi:MAG: DUF4835 family protein [Bacteroidales bacterium]|nr:DUF4835 family protein [Bacteroidales bacterium]